jgi:4-hydroxy-3-polyprenylbenzoate decarboxylase
MDSPLEERLFPSPRGNSALLIDATRKWPYPPTSLPGREFMEQARKIWEEEGLPGLIPQDPWYGVSLGYWTKENEEEAALAVEGEYYRTAEKLAKQKIKV